MQWEVQLVLFVRLEQHNFLPARKGVIYQNRHNQQCVFCKRYKSALRSDGSGREVDDTAGIAAFSYLLNQTSIRPLAIFCCNFIAEVSLMLASAHRVVYPNIQFVDHKRVDTRGRLTAYSGIS